MKCADIDELLTNNCTSISLGTETVKSAAGTLKSIDHVKCSNGFTISMLVLNRRTSCGMSSPFSMLSIGDGVADDILEENLKNSTSLLIDETRDTLYTATTG